MTTRINLLILVLIILSPLGAQAQEIKGRVVGVSDGDTITILDIDKHQTKVRLAEIDTPESAQPYGSRAKQELSGLVFGKTVQVKVQDTDRYGRTVGRVFADGIDVNAEMVRRGAAWVYRQYAKDQSLFGMEEEAKQAKRGIWSLPEAERIPPWEWRHAGREGTGNALIRTRQDTSRPTFGDGQGFTCGVKTVCRQMSSCAEARFYLNQCGLSRLDGDKDGIPCESICR